ncbi:MAG: D-alanyl-D-alanine carboxypeptidase [Desulfovibrio sp.]|nr:D-alanyl-D-alanine carboxypeptidase [Desulfovibrio sp.]
MRLFSFFLLLCILVLQENPAFARQQNFRQTPGSDTVEAGTPPIINVHSAILYDLTDDSVLFEQNADKRIQPASLTKVMSMFLALDAITDKRFRFDTPVTVSKKAASEGGSSMGIRAGERVPLGELLLGMAVSSGNDASYAVAELVGGSNQAFIAAMNAKARQLGMYSTHFCTPNGLPMQGQYTTARDMLILARAYLTKYPWALSFHNRRTLKHLNHISWNRNPLLSQYPGADGLKTGWVRASGYNMIFTAQRKKHRLLAVILGAPDALHRGVEACRMLDAGFLVCAQKEHSILEALEHLPFENYKIDLLKNAHDARARYGHVSSGKKKTRLKQNASVKNRKRHKTGEKVSNRRGPQRNKQRVQHKRRRGSAPS